jgi:hypothetical protein
MVRNGRDLAADAVEARRENRRKLEKISVGNRFRLMAALPLLEQNTKLDHAER